MNGSRSLGRARTTQREIGISGRKEELERTVKRCRLTTGQVFSEVGPMCPIFLWDALTVLIGRAWKYDPTTDEWCTVPESTTG